MSLVARQLPALFNGISQQPATLRTSSQGEVQENFYGTVAEGMRKRPPTQWLASLGVAPTAATMHFINRDLNERYLVVLTNGDLRVFTLDGQEQTVSFPGGKSYLDTSAPDQQFSVVTVADYSFIVNREVTVATKTAGSTLPADYSNYFNPWTNSPDAAEVQKRYYSSLGSYSYKGSVQTFEELPKAGSDNPPVLHDMYKVVGANESGFTGYYVIRRGTVWEETHAPGPSVGLDEATMPHALIRLSNGDFQFQPFAWPVRQFGDEVTNPPPSFVGSSINDVFFYKNRLGMVANENVVFSGAGDYGNFFRTTATQLLDSDPVDVAAGSTKVATLRYAVPFQNKLMLFAEQTQMALNVDELLTPTTVSIDTVTDFEIDTGVRPLGIGSDVYFITAAGAHSRVREYFVQEDANSTDAADVTAHTPRYLPSSIIDMAGSSNEDVMFLCSDSEGYRDRLYCYKFFWDGDGKVQSSWSHWVLPGNPKVLAVELFDHELYVVVDRDGLLYLEKVNLQSSATAAGLSFDLLLDRFAEFTGVYISGADATEVTLPYPLPEADRDLVRLIRTNGATPGSMVDPSTYTWVSDTKLRIPGDVGTTLHGGFNYNARYTFSEQFMKNGDLSVTTGRLILRTFTVYFTDTAYFQTEVAPYGGSPQVEAVVPSGLAEFTGKTLGAASLILGAPVFHTDRYTFHVYGDSREAVVSLTNDLPVQSQFQAAEWEALYHNRARAI